MAATVGELVVNLVARTGQFSRGLKTSGRQVDTWSKGIETAGKRVAAWGAGMLGVASVGGLAALVKRELEALDATNKLSDRLGISTEKIGGLQYAAEMSGVAVNTLNMALQRMTRRVAEAAQGGGEAQAAIKELGLDAERLGSMVPDQMFYAIADALQKVQSQSDRVRLAFKLFDSEGVALLQMLKGGSQELANFQSEAEKLGRAFGKDVHDGATKAVDAITRLKAAVSGQMTKGVAESAGDIESLANTLAKAMPHIARMADIYLQTRLNPIPERAAEQLGEKFWAWTNKQLQLPEREEFDVLEAMPPVGPPPPPPGIVAHRRLMEELYGEEAQKAVAEMNRQREEVENAWGQSMMAAAEAEAEAIAEGITKGRERIRGVLQSILGAAGGDGGRLGLPGAVGQQSAEAYSILVRHMMGPTQQRDRKDEEILRLAREQLRRQDQMEQHLRELVGKAEGQLHEAHF